MNNKNYRVMKFFEPVNKKDKSRGYVRLDIRGMRGNIIVSVESLGDVKSVSEVYLYKDKANKLKLGDINNKKGMIKKSLTFGDNSAIEDYNTCAVVKDKKIVLYTNLFNSTSLEHIKKLEYSDEDDITPVEVDKFDNITQELDETTTEAEEVEPQTINEEPITELQEILEPVVEEEVQEILRPAEEEVKEIVELVEEKEAEVKEMLEHVEEKQVEQFVDTTQQKVVLQDERIKKESVSSAVNLNVEPKAEAQSHRFKNKFEESLYNALKEYEQIEPLSVKIKDFNWWYIPYDETGIKNGFLPYYNQIISSYYPYPISNRVTTCSGLMKKYGHYIFGIYKENGDIVRFIYGIPGEFSKEEQPYKGITGFKNWSYGRNQDESDHGYWLAFVNPKTGETTEPPETVLS